MSKTSKTITGGIKQMIAMLWMETNDPNPYEKSMPHFTINIQNTDMRPRMLPDAISPRKDGATTFKIPHDIPLSNRAK